MRGSRRPNRTATYWPPLLWPSAFLSRSSGLLNRRPGGPDLCWVLFYLQHHFSISSGLQTHQLGVWGLPLLGAGFLYRNLTPTGLVSKLTDFLSSPSYMIVQSPTQYLPITGHRNTHGIFHRHRAEITVMQFPGHSLSVQQFVTLPWDFNSVPYCLPSSPAPMEYATSASLEWHVLPGQRSIYYMKSTIFIERNQSIFSSLIP